MTNNEKILARCKEIIDLGRITCNRSTIFEYHLQEFQASAENIYNLIFSNNVPKYYDLYRNTDKIEEISYLNEARFDLRRFQAFTKDYQSGLINSLENILSLETYGSLIEHAIELNSYNDINLSRAACILARLMLEDTLRKMCKKQGIEVEGKPKAAFCNDLLKKNNIYTKTQHKHITVWLDIGNAAAHPESEFESISESQKEDMIRQVEEFSLKYLS